MVVMVLVVVVAAVAAMVVVTHAMCGHAQRVRIPYTVCALKQRNGMGRVMQP